MRRRTFLKQSSLAGVGLFLSPILLTHCKEDSLTEATAVKSTPPIKELKFLVLEGTPNERGQIHGEALKSEINDIVRSLTEPIIKAMVEGEVGIRYIDDWVEVPVLMGKAKIRAFGAKTLHIIAGNVPFSLKINEYIEIGILSLELTRG